MSKLRGKIVQKINDYVEQHANENLKRELEYRESEIASLNKTLETQNASAIRDARKIEFLENKISGYDQIDYIKNLESDHADVIQERNDADANAARLERKNNSLTNKLSNTQEELDNLKDKRQRKADAKERKKEALSKIKVDPVQERINFKRAMEQHGIDEEHFDKMWSIRHDKSALDEYASNVEAMPELSTEDLLVSSYIEEAKDAIESIADRRPEEIASALRGWLNEDELGDDR